MLDRLDRRCQDFIAASPLVVVGSSDPLGMVDLSPKGDREQHVPDRQSAGDNRLLEMRRGPAFERIAL